MSSTVTYKCPNCDAGLIFDAEKQSFVCEFCISSFTEAELNTTDAAEKEEASKKANADFADEMNEYVCQSCGAAVIVDNSTLADFCYYCHNPIVLVGKASGNLRPSKIIPFRFDKDEAKNIFNRYCKKKWFLPRDYFSAEQSDKIKGIYYPFWVTDADSRSNYQATGHKVRTWRSGNYRYTETSRYKIERSGEIHFEDISTSAISSEDKKMLEGILPYSLNEHIDFSLPYLQGFTAKKRDIEREQLSSEVKEKMQGYAMTLFNRTAHGYNSIHDESVGLNITGSHWEYTLMPIWILNYKRKGKNYTYAMNGSTGKIYGELPVSPWKLALAGVLAALAAGALSFLIGWGLFL